MTTTSTIPGTRTGEVLRADEAFGPWLDRLASAGNPTAPVVLPTGGETEGLLDFLAIPEDERSALLLARDEIKADPALTWVVERSVMHLRQSIDQSGALEPLPDLPEPLGTIAHYVYPWVFAAIVPDTLAAARKRGIPEDVMRATFADVGRHFLIHRAQTGTGGMTGQDWLVLHARLRIYQLGRLQFERARLGGRTSAGIREAGFDAAKGEPCLAIHIPSFMGSFPPDVCDHAFSQATAFFPLHFPDEHYRYATCHSWLLDPQLAEYLPPSSNIIAFQRRFQPAYTPDANDRVTLEFVFRTPDKPLSELPQRTTLERAVVYHLVNGRHWHGGAGWFPLTPPTGKDDA